MSSSTSSSLRVPPDERSQRPAADADTSTKSTAVAAVPPRISLPTFTPLTNGRSPSRDDARAESSASGSHRSRSRGGGRSHSRGSRSLRRDKSAEKEREEAGRSGSGSAEGGKRREDGPTRGDGKGLMPELPTTTTTVKRKSEDRREKDSPSPAQAQAQQAAPQTTNHGSLGRRSNRSSGGGGFILGSIGRSGRMPRIFQGRPSAAEEEEKRKDRKGKSKSTDTSMTSQSGESAIAGNPYAATPVQQTPLVTKLRHAESRPGSSIGSSPLSTEVTMDGMEGSDGRLQPTGLGARSSSLDVPTQKIEIRKRPTTSVGYDTDPAQIVNMALTLSEARRRQASERRYDSAGLNGRSRVVSSATTASARNRQQQPGSVSHYLHAQRTPSVTSHPGTPRLEPDKKPSANPAVGDASVPDDEDDAMDVDDFEQEVSAATKARVEKARVFFELAYEHRRLLSHLPPVRRPGATVYPPNDPDRQSKAYNPLQYIRNRKLRVWDKTAINAEAEGWHDVEKVRTWVNAVIESHSETRHDADECVRLPGLKEQQSGETSRETSASGSKDKLGRRHQHQDSIVKSRRPRSDWITHPGDIIADCFWLEQGVNKIKILDRDNNPIYPPHTQFKFSGWRNRTPVNIPEGLQQPTPPNDSEEGDGPKHQPLHPVSELPTFKSAHHDHEGTQRRKRNKVRESLAIADEGGLSKGLKNLMDDSDSSDMEYSSGSVSPGAERGRRRLRKRQRQDRDVSPGQMPPPQHVKLNDTNASDQSAPSSKPNSKRASVDQGSRVGRFLKRESAPKGSTPLNRSQTRGDHTKNESISKFSGLEERPRTSAEYDSTAPNSPTHPVWPSIAINLESPPHSRSPSPSKRHSHIPAILKPLHRHHKHESISAVDFGESKRSSTAAKDAEKLKDDSTDASRGTSPMTRGQSPMTKRDSNVSTGAATGAAVGAGIAAADHHGMSRYTTKSSIPSSEHGRIRGIFKGGRIAELVGHEVSKVGDFIWKKDPPPVAMYRRRGSEESRHSGYETDSETEAMNGTVLKTPPVQQRRSRSSTVSSTKSDSPNLSNKSIAGSGGRGKLHNPNLPSFTSPFDRDREVQERKANLLTPVATDGDHISRQALEHRSNSRSPRLDRLAPPKLDTGSRSSSTNRITPSQSREAGGLGLSLTRSREATTKLNTALADASALGPNQKRSTATALDLTRISTHDLDQESPYVTWRDIQRATAFLYSSTVKAREIGRQADLPRKHIPPYLMDGLSGFQLAQLNESTRANLAMVARREEKVVAARHIMATLTQEAGRFEDTLRDFSHTTAPSLHRLLQELEDQVDNQMTPRVRHAADEAGELSIRLATTSTLAVKGVNELIDAAMVRKVRGPVRWVRGAWYKSVELAVVGLLWGIWAVVSLVRGVWALGKGAVGVGRWLVWWG